MPHEHTYLHLKLKKHKNACGPGRDAGAGGVGQKKQFVCNCRGCTVLPDRCRAFRCPSHDCLNGKVCPHGDGGDGDGGEEKSSSRNWGCLDCGHQCSPEEIGVLLEAEAALVHKFETVDELGGKGQISPNRVKSKERSERGLGYSEEILVMVMVMLLRVVVMVMLLRVVVMVMLLRVVVMVMLSRAVVIVWREGGGFSFLHWLCTAVWVPTGYGLVARARINRKYRKYWSLGTPPRLTFQARLLHNQEDVNTDRYV